MEQQQQLLLCCHFTYVSKLLITHWQRCTHTDRSHNEPNRTASLSLRAECIDGHVRAQGASGCTPCPAGSYADGNECTQCAAGTAAELAASVECTACLSPLVPNAARTLCGECPHTTATVTLSHCYSTVS